MGRSSSESRAGEEEKGKAREGEEDPHLFTVVPPTHRIEKPTQAACGAPLTGYSGSEIFCKCSSKK